MKWLLALLMIPLMMLGCKQHKYDRTPAGWNVHWEDSGTEATGLHNRLQLFVLFDSAMERALQEVHTKWGFDVNYMRSKLHENDALYTLIDDYRFAVIGGPAQDAPNAQYATGETMNRVEVWIAFYNEHNEMQGLQNNVPSNAIPWTVRKNPVNGYYYWGQEDDGNQYPALGYEIHWQFTNQP